MAPSVSRLQMLSGEYVPEKKRGENDYLVISLVLKGVFIITLIFRNRLVSVSELTSKALVDMGEHLSPK